MLLLIDIGEAISKRRKAVGLTQAELAKMARVSRSTLDALENGRMGELGYMKVNNILISLGLEFKLQVAASKRPTLDDLMLENERLFTASTVSSRDDGAGSRVSLESRWLPRVAPRIGDASCSVVGLGLLTADSTGG